MAEMKKNLAAMQSKLAHKPAGVQPPSKGRGKGARKGGGSESQTKSDGWSCASCKKFNKGSKPFCYSCKQPHTQVDGPGRPVLPVAANAME
eukprot:3852314-Amphidinium_carterae.1